VCAAHTLVAAGGQDRKTARERESGDQVAVLVLQSLTAFGERLAHAAARPVIVPETIV
jgi:hypothetical protein